MKQLTITLPDSVDITTQEASTALAAQLYEMGKLSLGQAAELAGSTKREFMELLSNYGVSIFNYDVQELDSDITNAKNYHS
jgi:predicted HTH domain antitoxin